VDGLLAIAAWQVGDQINYFAGKLLQSAQPLLDLSSKILSSPNITSEQLMQVDNIHHNIKIIFGSVEGLNVTFWAAMGISMIALLQFAYNGTQSIIHMIKDAKNN